MRYFYGIECAYGAYAHRENGEYLGTLIPFDSDKALTDWINEDDGYVGSPRRGRLEADEAKKMMISKILEDNNDWFFSKSEAKASTTEELVRKYKKTRDYIDYMSIMTWM